MNVWGANPGKVSLGWLCGDSSLFPSHYAPEHPAASLSRPGRIFEVQGLQRDPGMASFSMQGVQGRLEF